VSTELELPPVGPSGAPTLGSLPAIASELKFAVLSLGARMHYAVPAILQRANMLQAFYTDAVGDVGMLSLMNRMIPVAARPKSMRRLFGRLLPENVSKEVVVSAPGRSLAHAAFSRVPGGRTLASATSPSSWLHRTMVSEDFRGANALYCMDNGDLDVIRAARQRGMFIVYEQTCCPEIGRILRTERDLFPGLEQQASAEFVESGIERDREVWALSDVVLAPSAFVRDSMVRLGHDPDRIALVPYGLSEDWFETPSRPKPGRVLFVGSVCLLKGAHYLAEARRILEQRGVATEFRVVGPTPDYVAASPLFQGPEYVGQVPRSQVRAEFAEADVFVFPTLSESFGLVHLEALACGVPVITTPNCGSVVRHGVDGFIVPVRDPVGLANRIQQVISNRD
jgi:glycosyltransferase involved in cell wall biosynthesis